MTWAEPVKGEVTLVLGPIEPVTASKDDAVERARVLMAEGTSISDAARRAASELGVSRRDVYEELIGDQASS